MSLHCAADDGREFVTPTLRRRPQVDCQPDRVYPLLIMHVTLDQFNETFLIPRNLNRFGIKPHLFPLILLPGEGRTGGGGESPIVALLPLKSPPPPPPPSPGYLLSPPLPTSLVTSMLVSTAAAPALAFSVIGSPPPPSPFVPPMAAFA